jgi:hypothetical protein
MKVCSGVILGVEEEDSSVGKLYRFAEGLVRWACVFPDGRPGVTRDVSCVFSLGRSYW